MGEEVFKLASIVVGRVILGGIGYLLRRFYYQIIGKSKKLCIDDYENKVVAFAALLIFFVALYFWF